MSDRRTSDVDSNPVEPIAIIGIACRFPGGADNPAAFWQLLIDGRDAIQPIERAGLDLSRFYDPRPRTPGRMMTQWGGFLEDLELFDAEFFGISPREAASLDPGQRLLLETAWEALEDATLDPASLRGAPVGVYVGQWLSDFESRLFADASQVDLYSTTGSGRYATSGRLSYFLGLTGPSLTVDTACSSSLVAIHLACQSLRAGESSLAIAAGVNVILQPHITIAYSQSGMMAPDGRCKFGDASGDGYVRSEGAGVTLLKPLARALADGDPIRAVIRGSAVNNDGRGSGHLATPSRTGQAAMLRTAYANAGVAPQHVGYVEAHGTGTRAGDPIELGALGDVLAPNRSTGARCLVGSVKTNIGHTEGAAGMAGLLKSVLALEHGEVPASLHLREPSPAIAWERLPFDIPRARAPWPSNGRPRVAGVSGFGITGTNAHVVLEEAPAPAPGQTPARAPDTGLAHLLVLSAVTPRALQVLAAAYADRLEAGPAPSLADVCATAARHRAALEHRAVFVAEDRVVMAERLRGFSAGDANAAVASGHAAGGGPRRVAFVFPGQGGQWAGMTRQLLECEPAFREAIERCDAAMPKGLGWSVLEQLGLDAGSAGNRQHEIGVLQPTLLAVEIALAELWRSWGITPDAAVGHSMGEIGAAYMAGALSLPDAMRVICARSRLLQRTSGAGAMALVGLSAEETRRRIAARAGVLVSVAAVNGLRSTVISGDPDAVAALLADLAREDIFCRAVQVDVASHSAQMDPLVPELVATLRDLSARPASIALYSTVRGRRVEDGECDAEYWGQNLRQPVMFAATIERLLADGIDTVIEVGPHPTLLASVAEVGSASAPLTLASLRRGEPERASLLASLGALWAAGHPVSWDRLFPSGAYARVPLPHYPWQRERHWSDAALPVSAEGTARRAGLDDTVRSWLYTPQWERAPLMSGADAPARWLLVASPMTDALSLAASLRERGSRVDVVSSLAGAVEWIGTMPSAALRGLGIVFLVAPGDEDPAAGALTALQTLQHAWPAEVAQWVPRLWWLTRGAHVLPGDRAHGHAAAHGALWGAARVFAQEHPDWWGGVVDLEMETDPPAPADLLAQHLGAGTSEDQVALRAGERYALRVVRAEATAGAGDAYRWRADAAYLITGGFGGLALRIAAAMVGEGARRLILVGRTALPERSAWAAEPETSEAGRRIAAVRALEHAGAAVHLVQADVADYFQVRAALETYHQEGWPPIRGVIHTAAVLENRLTTDMDREAFDRVLAPKLAGALVLDRLLPSLDLFVMFSSISAFWAPPGMSNYAAANAGLDALAQARRARGQHALSIQWGPWAGVGLHERAIAARSSDELQRAGIGSIPVDAGTLLFAALLTRHEPVIAVLPIDWPMFRRAWQGRDRPLFRSASDAGMDPGAVVPNGRFPECLREASPVARRSLVEGLVREALAGVIRRPANQLDSRRSFGAMGLDSLMAVELRNRLETAIERSLPATLAWNYSTIEALVEYLDALSAPAQPAAAEADECPTLPGEDFISTSFLDSVASLSDADAARALRGGR